MPTDEQMQFWGELYKHNQVYCLKARQVFFTTASLFEMLVYCIINTIGGNSLAAWTVYHEASIASEKIEDLAEWLGQLAKAPEFTHANPLLSLKKVKSDTQDAGFSYQHIKGNQPEIRIYHPALGTQKPTVIRGLTAGSDGIGIGRTPDYVHWTELPNSPNPDAAWSAIEPALTLNGRLVMETTMKRYSHFCEQKWEERNSIHKVFTSANKAPDYRIKNAIVDGAPIAEETLQKWLDLGAADAEVAAWAEMKSRNYRTLKQFLTEYPFTVQQCFETAEGRWFTTIPEIIRPQIHIAARAQTHLDTEPPKIEIYDPPSRLPSARYLLSCDVAGAKGRSNSIVVCLRIDDNTDEKGSTFLRICALWYSSAARAKQQSNVAKYMREMYRTVDTYGHHGYADIFPDVLVEINGIGGGLVDRMEDVDDAQCGEAFMPIQITQTEASKMQALTFTSEFVEDGTFVGPALLAMECKKLLYIRPDSNPDGRADFVGPKDLSMALGQACNFLLLEKPIDSRNKHSTQIERDIENTIAFDDFVQK